MALGSNSGMGFLRTNDSQLIETGEIQFGFRVLLKTVRVDCLLAENKISKKYKIEDSFKRWVTRVKFLG